MEKEISKNSFKGYQEERVANRLLVIKDQIDIYKKQEVKFKNITELASIIANQITKKEGTTCSRTTILRNDKYKILLEDFFYAQDGRNKANKASTIIAELTQSNIERENFRLKQYISNLEKELDELKNNVISNKETQKNVYLSEDESKFNSICKALTQLIQHFEGLVTIDKEKGLIDSSKRVNNIIVDKEILKEFIKWSDV